MRRVGVLLGLAESDPELRTPQHWLKSISYRRVRRDPSMTGCRSASMGNWYLVVEHDFPAFARGLQQRNRHLNGNLSPSPVAQRPVTPAQRSIHIVEHIAAARKS